MKQVLAKTMQSFYKTVNRNNKFFFHYLIFQIKLWCVCVQVGISSKKKVKSPPFLKHSCDLEHFQKLSFSLTKVSLTDSLTPSLTDNVSFGSVDYISVDCGSTVYGFAIQNLIKKKPFLMVVEVKMPGTGGGFDF